MSKKISIIIPAFNQLAYCRECIESLKASTPSELYELILVDNGSTDGVSEYFDGVEGAVVIHSPTNLGFAAGVNLGLSRTRGHALLLNSDTVLPRGWLERLHAAMMQSEDIGLVGPRSNCVSGAQLIPDLNLDNYTTLNNFAEKLAHENVGRIRYVARLVGFCLLIRDTVLRRIGLFDEAYGIGNFEDDDYCVRALRAGFKLAIAEDAFVFHYGGRTFTNMGINNDRFNELINKNMALFDKKLQPAAEERNDAVQHAMAMHERGVAAFEAQAFTQALKYLIDSLKAYPAYGAAHITLATVLHALHQPARACEHFRRGLELRQDGKEIREVFLACAEACGQSEAARVFLDSLAPQHETDATGTAS